MESAFTAGTVAGALAGIIFFIVVAVVVAVLYTINFLNALALPGQLAQLIASTLTTTPYLCAILSDSKQSDLGLALTGRLAQRAWVLGAEYRPVGVVVELDVVRSRLSS